RLRFAGGGRRGALLASYEKLAVGFELAGQERRLKLLGARRWFASYSLAGGHPPAGRAPYQGMSPPAASGGRPFEPTSHETAPSPTRPRSRSSPRARRSS